MILNWFFFCLVFLSYLFEKYLEQFLYTLGIYASMRFLYTVDTGGGDRTANFAELDSDYSEPGKHVWTFDMMSVFHVCLSGFRMACLYDHLWK